MFINDILKMHRQNYMKDCEDTKTHFEALFSVQYETKKYLPQFQC